MKHLKTTAKIVNKLTKRPFHKPFGKDESHTYIGECYVTRSVLHHERKGRHIFKYTIHIAGRCVGIIRTTEENGASTELSYTWSINPKDIKLK